MYLSEQKDMQRDFFIISEHFLRLWLNVVTHVYVITVCQTKDWPE